MHRGLEESKFEMRIEGATRKCVPPDDTEMFLFNIDNYFIVGADQSLDRDLLNKETGVFH